MSTGKLIHPAANATNGDTPDVAMRPPRLYLGALTIGLLIEFFLPTSILDITWLEPHQRLIGTAISACGFLLLTACMLEFHRARTNVPTSLPATTVVESGSYAWSRNPIYVALTAIYVGIALAAKSAWVFGLIVPVLVIMRYGVIAREEAYLAHKFGDAYLAYKERVRRWL